MKLRPEAAVLLLGTRVRMERSDIARTAKILIDSSRQFDWGFFIEQAMAHKVAPLIAKNFEKYRLHFVSGFPLRELLRATYLANRMRNISLYAELENLLKALNDRNIVAVVRKGIMLADKVYGDIGTRQMSDFDLLVTQGDADSLSKLLIEMGSWGVRRCLCPRHGGVYRGVYAEARLSGVHSM